MLCYILTTGQCNLKCGYCGGSFPQEVVPYEVKNSIDDLAQFLVGVRVTCIGRSSRVYNSMHAMMPASEVKVGIEGYRGDLLREHPSFR